jgi:hypothetical protein
MSQNTDEITTLSLPVCILDAKTSLFSYPKMESSIKTSPKTIQLMTETTVISFHSPLGRNHSVYPLKKWMLQAVLLGAMAKRKAIVPTKSIGNKANAFISLSSFTELMTADSKKRNCSLLAT